MNLDQLTYFIKVAELRHLTHASEELNISEPALSKSIARLEDELGINLFDRVGRNIYLNRNGEAFLPYARKSLQTITEGIDTVNSFRTNDSDSVKIQTIPLIIFPRLLESILFKYPDVKITGSAEPAYILEENLLTDKTDLCFTSKSFSNTNINCIKINTEPIMIIFSDDHHFANADFVTPDKLTGEKFIVGNEYSSLNRDFNSIFEKEKNKPLISQTITSTNETLDYVANGRGIAAMSLSIYADLLKRQPCGVKAVPVYSVENTPLTISQKLYWRKKYNSPKVFDVKKLITGFFKSYIGPSI